MRMITKIRLKSYNIRDTQDITLTLEADESLQWWVDSSYAVHSDIKTHTGVLLFIG